MVVVGGVTKTATLKQVFLMILFIVYSLTQQFKYFSMLCINSNQHIIFVKILTGGFVEALRARTMASST